MRGKSLLLALVMGILLPSLFVSIAEKLFANRYHPPKAGESTLQTQIQNEIAEGMSDNIAVLLADGNVKKMEMDTYITGVVLGEMPADFEKEALMAQSVVARTYALKRSTGNKHMSGAVCTDSTCCQAYCSPETYLSHGGSQADINKIQLAVKQTSRQVLTYQGELIDATYFSCSGGRTEDAEAVWGTEIPYLQAVDSPGEENASHYSDTVQFSIREFADKLGISLTETSTVLLGGTTYTDGGGVDTVDINGKSYKGTFLRKVLGLRSTAFSMSVSGEVITITTKGFGHRVGMSQYGADAMAVNGSDYQQILSHYYPGTQLKSYPQN